jgi:hypothetical protein
VPGDSALGGLPAPDDEEAMEPASGSGSDADEDDGDTPQKKGNFVQNLKNVNIKSFADSILKKKPDPYEVSINPSRNKSLNVIRRVPNNMALKRIWKLNRMFIR